MNGTTQSLIMDSFKYNNAQLKHVSGRYFIEYWQWHPIEKKKVRIKKSHGLGRIKDSKLRSKKAKEIVDRINSLLPTGYPFSDLKVASTQLSIIEALDVALKIKLASTRTATRNSYSSTASIFAEYIKRKGWSDLEIVRFTKPHALSFLDYCLTERKSAGVTYNNYLNKMKALFFELVERGYIPDNPFSKLKKKKEQGKKRRAFTKKERKVVLKRVRATNEFLYLAVLLQYYCFIRPKEITRIKKHMFDFERGLIQLPGHITKNGFNEMVTIPDCIVHDMKRIVSDIPDNYFVFGSKLKPNAIDNCSKNYMSRIHRGLLKDLHREEEIVVLDGLTFYSWKDTGAKELFKNKINPNEVMRQMRHKDLAYTQRYSQSLHLVNNQIKEFVNEI